ncbi:MAG: lipase maturation factor family protein, partial [Methanobacteriota archaeon]
MRTSVWHVAFARLLAGCYAVAFISWCIQFRGLASQEAGITPTPLHSAAPHSHESVWSLFVQRPTLLHFAPHLGMSVSAMVEALACAGIVCACAAILCRTPRASLFAAMYGLYLSLYATGNVWLSFQWDILLLEVGWAAIWLFAAAQQGHVNTTGAWLLRFTLFKLMLMAGAVKLQSGCATWKALTATEVHYASQCLPTPGAWWAHSVLPPLAHKLSVAATLFIELPATLLLITPITLAARVGAALQAVLQVNIMLTGNYNFFNILTLGLCMLQLPAGNQAYEARLRTPLLAYSRTAYWAARAVLLVALLAAGAFTWLAMFEFVPATAQPEVARRATASRPSVTQNEGSAPAMLPWWNAYDLRLRKEVLAPGTGMDAWLTAGLPHVVRAVWCLLAGCALWSIVQHVRPAYVAAKDAPHRLGSARVALGAAVAVFGSVLSGAAVLLTFSASSTSLLSLEPSLLSPPRWPASFAVATHRAVQPWHIASGYGLFRAMTGVGTQRARDAWGRRVTTVARPEVVIEGLWPMLDVNTTAASGGMQPPSSQSQIYEVHLSPSAAAALAAAQRAGSASDGVWLEMEFPYKPGDPTQAPRIVAPHQPRLDWQMWFAALGSYQSSPWIVSLADKLLEGEPAAYALLATDRFPVRHTFTWQHEANAQADSREAASASTGAAEAAQRRVTALVPPLAIRMSLYHYDFTRSALPWGRTRVPALDTQAYNTSAMSSLPWWQRRRVGDYLPAVPRGDASVNAFVAQMGVARRPATLHTPTSAREHAHHVYECAQSASQVKASNAARSALASASAQRVWDTWRVSPASRDWHSSSAALVRAASFWVQAAAMHGLEPTLQAFA